MKDKIKRNKEVFILVGLAYLFFMLGNGILSLTNPDEVFYAQTAKEMAQQNSWMAPYLFGAPQFEKPILIYWFLRIGFILFGVSSFAARFFPSLFAILGVIAVYFLGNIGYKNKNKAFISSLILLSCGFYIGLARTVFTDMIFSVLILFSLLSFYWGYSQVDKKSPGILLFFIFSGFAVLTKGPLGFLIPFLIVFTFLVIKKDIKFLFCKSLSWGIFIFLLVSLPWYIFMIKKYGYSFTSEFFYNDHLRRIIEAEHPANDKWYFYLFSMIGGMFPWSLFVFISLFYLFKNSGYKTQSFYTFLASWIVVVFLIFQFTHSKLTSYILPLFPALAIVTGDFLHGAINSNKRQIFILSLLSWLILCLLPVGLAIGSIKYAAYLPSKIMVYNFIFLYAILLIIILAFFIMKRRWPGTIYLVSLQVPLFLLFALLSHKNFETYVSSKSACEYLLNHEAVSNKILCSRPFLRGVRFYTDKDMALVNMGGTNFFSPHPIINIDSEGKARDFFKSQSITYCILTKSALVNIENVARDNRFKINILKIIGNEYIVKIQTG